MVLTLVKLKQGIVKFYVKNFLYGLIRLKSLQSYFASRFVKKTDVKGEGNHIYLKKNDTNLINISSLQIRYCKNNF